MVSLELACRKNGRVRLLTDADFPLHGDQRGHPSHWRVNVNPNLKLGVIPDRVFALKFETQSGKSERAFFFLEADRGTMPITRRNLSQTSFYRKLLAYEATWVQSIHRTQFGFHRFRVITVTSGAGRLRSLIEACSQLERGHGLFLFTDKMTLAKCPNIFSLKWQTGRKDETTDLLNSLWPSPLESE
jgi:hypothetical protein